MSETTLDQTQRTGRKPRASLGSPEGDDVFGVFDTKIARRFFSYLGPHKKMLVIAQIAVLVSAASQVVIPLLIGRAVDSVVKHDGARFQQTLIAFAVMAGVYTAMFFTEQWLSQRLAQRVIFDIRRAMFAHFQDVSLSFMDKTHVGRIMARLQGDVGALQEFLETTTGALGDMVMLVGIAAVLLSMDVQLGLLTLTVLPALIAIRCRS
jgi:ATP-binding cassette subfamily B protein